ncbi:hypothetical protein [Microcoleus sp. S13_C5]|uniref:hypothetical protein n=1 Tax=Microcoleus sp. S13_C5 TaxID=3055411 RepID=UPI002FD23B5D
MTNLPNLPKRTDAQRIGVSAADLLNSVFTKFCNVHPVQQDRDMGIDFICELIPILCEVAYNREIACMVRL